MVVLSEVLGIVISLIIFIFLVTLFFSIFGSPECGALANATAQELRIAINRVALEDGVSPYYGDGVPPDEAEDQFVTVPIRLCEKDPLMVTGFAVAHTPSYVLVYETFPPAGLSWFEGQPWSGGSMSALESYILFRYGPQALIAIPKFASWVYKGAKKIATFTFSIGAKMTKLHKWWDSLKNSRVIRFFLRNQDATDAVRSVERNVLDTEYYKYIPEEHMGTLNSINRKMNLDRNMEPAEAIATTIGKSAIDKRTGEILSETIDTDVVKGVGVYKNARILIDPQHKKFYNYIYDLSDDAQKKIMDDIFYVPSWLDRGKWWLNRRWYGLKDAVGKLWRNSRLNQGVAWLKDKYSALKKWAGFTNNNNFLKPKDTPQKIGAYKRYFYVNLNEFKDHIKDHFDKYKGHLTDATGKTFKNADDISDADVFKFLSVYEKYYNSGTFAEFIVQAEAPIIHAYQTMGSTITNKIDEIAMASDPATEWARLVDMFPAEFDSLNAAQLDELRRTVSFGHGPTYLVDDDILKQAYSDARAYLIKEGVLDSNKVFDPVSGSLRISYLTRAADGVQGELFTAPFKRVGLKGRALEEGVENFYLRDVLPPSIFEKIKELNKNPYVGKGKRFLFLDLGRVGRGPLDIIWPFGAAAARENIEKLTDVVEGGCYMNSICSVSKDGATAYLLDEDVPEKVSSKVAVRLWRPKPTRIPVGISTGMFLLSVNENPRFYVVSPCFAMAKVWKDREDQVYVYIDKTKKCDVSGCEQTSPLESIDTPNYCYASEDFVWGVYDGPSEVGYLAELGVCTALMTVATKDWRNSLKYCSYITIGTLGIEVTARQEEYTGPSWERQEKGWGYWNYIKAEDLCDLIETIGDFGGWRAGKAGSTGKFQDLSGWLKKHSKTASAGGWMKNRISDICFLFTLTGDNSLAWSIKTPVLDVWRKGTPLTDVCIQETAAECVWCASRCDSPDQCPDPANPDPANYDCINNCCLRKAE